MKNSIRTNTIYIDFDGTIVDVYERYFGVLQSFINKTSPGQMHFNSFIKLKRSGLKDHEIANKLTVINDFNIEKYVKYKTSHIESLNWLSKDKLIGNFEQFISKCHDMNYSVSLLTQRRNPINLYIQLEKLNIYHFFDNIHVVTPKVGRNVKYELLKENIQFNSPTIIIGDSNEEIKAGNILGLRTFYVRTGLHDSKWISNPTTILNSYEDVIPHLLKI